MSNADPRARRWRPLLFTTALALVIATLSYASSSGTKPSAAHDPGDRLAEVVRPVRTVVVAPAPARDAQAAVGEIRPYRESDLGFRVSGKVIARLVNIGAVVSKGQILARVEDDDYRNRLRSAKADQVAAQAVLVEAQAAEDRLHRLIDAGHTTRANYDVSVKNLRSAQAKLDAANAALDMAKDQLAYTELRADFDGVVTNVAAEEGQIVTVGQMVVRLAEPDRKDAVFSIAEASFAHLRDLSPASAVEVSLLSHPGVKAHGRVRQISPIADATTRTFQVKVALDDPSEDMRFGASVVGRLDVEGRRVVTLPASALFDSKGEPAVWVVDADSRVGLRPVAVTRFEVDRVIVEDGLQAGDIVVVTGVNRLRERQKVLIASGESK